MKIGLKTIVLALVVALLCVPAAYAKGPGGHGHGKPSWAGQGKSHEKKAKLDKAHAKKAKHEKAKHQKFGSEDAAELDLADLNPAWQCFLVESMMDEQDAQALANGAEPGESSSFDAEFGTNDNKRNSHGKCVSEAAQGGDVSAALADDEEESCEDRADTSEDPPAEDPAAEDPATGDAADDSAADDSTADEPAADDPADDGSGEPADSGDCQSDDPASEDDQAADDDSGEQTEAAAFASALVSFLGL